MQTLRCSDDSCSTSSPPGIRRQGPWYFLAAGLIAQLALAAPGQAADWQVISGDRLIVSSTCIGSNETPQCLADSAMACGSWSVDTKHSPDGTFIEDAICFAPGVNQLGVWPPTTRISEELMIHHYFVDFWSLDEAEIWHRARSSPDPWKAGDIVADFYVVTCTPEDNCIQTLPSGTATQDILTLCPRTYCIGSPQITQNLDGNGLLLFEPGYTLILRQEADGWQVLDWYRGVASTGSLGDFWYPKRWQRPQ